MSIFKLGPKLLALAFMASGCATSTNNDPLESYNRKVFSINEKIDDTALKPIATAYRSHTPSFVRTGVGNFFGNIGDVWSSLNQFLQGQVSYGTNSFMRVAFNSTFGLLGVLDIASEARMQKRSADFGQTLGVWGVPSGPYVVLPVLGSSTLRDSAGTVVDLTIDPWYGVTPIDLRNTGSALRITQQRASLLDASSLVDDIALDKYSFLRDSYLQRRQYVIDNLRDK